MRKGYQNPPRYQVKSNLHLFLPNITYNRISPSSFPQHNTPLDKQRCLLYAGSSLTQIPTYAYWDNPGNWLVERYKSGIHFLRPERGRETHLSLNERQKLLTLTIPHDKINHHLSGLAVRSIGNIPPESGVIKVKNV